MDTSLVVECLLFSVQIVRCLVKAISESAKPHETSRMVWSFGGLGNKNPKKFWRHGKREEVGFMWTRMLLGCISTSISQQSSQQCVTLERFEVSKRKELLAVQVGWSFKRKSDEKTGNCPYWMGKPQSAFEARSQCKPNSIKSHETIQMSQFYVFHAIQLAIGAICGLYFATSSQGFVNLCVADPSTGGFVCIPGPEQLQQCFVHMLMMIVFVHICAYFAVYAQILWSTFWHFHLTTSHMGGSHVPAFQEQICESLGGAQRLRKQGVIQTDLAIHFIFVLTAISLHIHCCHTQDHIKPIEPTFHTALEQVTFWLWRVTFGKNKQLESASTLATSCCNLLEEQLVLKKSMLACILARRPREVKVMMP